MQKTSALQSYTFEKLKTKRQTVILEEKNAKAEQELDFGTLDEEELMASLPSIEEIQVR